MRELDLSFKPALMLCCCLKLEFASSFRPLSSDILHLNLPLPSVVGLSAGTCYTWITLPSHCCKLCCLFLVHLHESIWANEVTQPSHSYKGKLILPITNYKSCPLCTDTHVVCNMRNIYRYIHYIHNYMLQ